ncbi:hypothetical protein [Plantibacter sp. YIM 135249]|uniref:hypothetical protein n=1 Tax=Plantibacter sp. YIM 135249 TaxID=3423918 RepID=UPI003D34A153
MSILTIRRTGKTPTAPVRNPREKRTPNLTHAALDDPYLAFVRWRAAGRPTPDRAPLAGKDVREGHPLGTSGMSAGEPR